MDIPYYKQKKVWSCGVASMRMVLESIGIKISRTELEKLLKSNETSGTWNKAFPAAAEKFKLNYVVGRNSDIKELKKLLKEKYKIIIGYYLGGKFNRGHYSVVRKIDSKKIHLLDPWFGAGKKFELSYFNKIWKNNPEKDNEKKWFFAVKKS